MVNKEILQADLLDILFEHRNKAYGAYALRKSYPRRLQWALGTALSLISIPLIINVSHSKASNPSSYHGKVVVLSTVDLPGQKPKPQQPQKPKLRPQAAQVAYTSRVRIVPDNTKTQMPDVKAIDTSLISVRSAVGINANSNTNTGQLNASGGENAAGHAKAKNEPKFDSNESEAQFPGGNAAFAKFMTRYLVTPDDLEAGQKKIVLVRFMVDVDGSISKMEIVQSDGDRYSEEVMRVLRKMPRWIPASQNGIKVATWFTQPVTFIGFEQ